LANLASMLPAFKGRLAPGNSHSMDVTCTNINYNVPVEGYFWHFWHSCEW
jgi:hypothetical protein